MKVTAIGCGYLGAVRAVCMASLSHEVVGIDVDQAKVRALSAGKALLHEPGLGEVIAAETASGCLRFTAESTAQGLSGTGIHFITVGTPQSDEGGPADLSHLMGTVSVLTELLDPAERTAVVGKPTVFASTAHIVEEKLTGTATALTRNPGLLRGGYVVEDTLRPTRLVYGLLVDADSAFRGCNALDEVYRSIIEAGYPVIVDSFSTAEPVKVVANSFLATKISFINAMTEICDAIGVDAMMFAQVLGYDERIGRRALGAGIGFDGGCLPRDIRVFVAHAEELDKGESVAFLREVDAINTHGRTRAIAVAEAALGGPVMGRNITVLGVSLKPDMDDVCDSPALDVASRLRKRGANVRVADPTALTNAAAHKPYPTMVGDMHAALTDAGLVVLATEWSQFVNMDPAVIGPLMRSCTVVDGYNALDREAWNAAGWTHVETGR